MSVQNVIDVLHQTDEMYRKIIELGKEKQQAIMDNDIALLTKLMNQEARLLKQTEELDELREQAALQFLQENGIRSQLKLTITEMTRLVFDVTEKQQLLAAQAQLSDTLRELKRLNGINKELVEQSLTFIDYSLNLFVSEPEDDMMYRDPSKQHAAQKPRSFFDTRA